MHKATLSTKAAHPVKRYDEAANIFQMHLKTLSNRTSVPTGADDAQPEVQQVDSLPLFQPYP